LGDENFTWIASFGGGDRGSGGKSFEIIQPIFYSQKSTDKTLLFIIFIKILSFLSGKLYDTEKNNGVESFLLSEE
jgi:hypothetical protein